MWHLTRVADGHISELIPADQLWVTTDVAGRFGLPPDPGNSGYGHSAQEVAAVRPESADALLDYVELTQAGKLPPGYVRVAKALLRVFRECPGGRLVNYWSTLEEIVYGWAALPLLKHDVPKGNPPPKAALRH